MDYTIAYSALSIIGCRALKISPDILITVLVMFSTVELLITPSILTNWRFQIWERVAAPG